jgi:ribose transport system substrate-binding protein
MNSMKTFKYLFLFIIGISLSACGTDMPDTRGDGSSDGKPKIGVSILTLTHPFFHDLTDAMQETAEELGFEITITSCEFDAARQRNQVSDFIVQKVDAIILAPCDSKAIGTSIQEANAVGIPVFTADIAAIGDDITVVTHVATDNYSGGRLAGEAVLEALGGSGKIAIIDHPEVESVIMRTRGFHEVIDAAMQNGKDLEIVAQLPGGGVKDKAFRVAEDILQAHADLDAIFAINDETALGSVAAIEKAGKTGQIHVVGFDGTNEARKAIKEGKIYADVLQHPLDIGRKTIEAINQYRSGETIPAQTLIPVSLYRKTDAETDPLFKE